MKGGWGTDAETMGGKGPNVTGKAKEEMFGRTYIIKTRLTPKTDWSKDGMVAVLHAEKRNTYRL